MNKERIVPEELCDIFSEYTSLYDLKQMYVKIPFSYKKAVRAGRSAERKRTKFWRKLYKLYPDIYEKATQWRYDKNRGIIYCEEDEE